MENQQLPWVRLLNDPNYIAFHLKRIAPLLGISETKLVTLLCDNPAVMRLCVCKLDYPVTDAWIDQVSRFSTVPIQFIEQFIPFIDGYFDSVSMSKE